MFCCIRMNLFVVVFVHAILTVLRTCEFFNHDTLICRCGSESFGLVVLWEAVMRKSPKGEIVACCHVPCTLFSCHSPV